MREAVKILIDRMVSHPDDFRKGGKLHWTVGGGMQEADARGLTEEEAKALHEAYQDCKYQLFHNSVMNSLLNETKGF